MVVGRSTNWLKILMQVEKLRVESAGRLGSKKTRDR